MLSLLWHCAPALRLRQSGCMLQPPPMQCVLHSESNTAGCGASHSSGKLNPETQALPVALFKSGNTPPCQLQCVALPGKDGNLMNNRLTTSKSQQMLHEVASIMQWNGCQQRKGRTTGCSHTHIRHTHITS